MAATGFGAYDGFDYVGLYEPTDAHPGLFVDRHEPTQRIRMLRRLKRVPSVIVETHQAWNLDEAERWSEPATLNAFAVALIQALKE
jgi:N-acetylmuramoyl-L-alanine amidase